MNMRPRCPRCYELSENPFMACNHCLAHFNALQEEAWETPIAIRAMNLEQQRSYIIKCYKSESSTEDLYD